MPYKGNKMKQTLGILPEEFQNRRLSVFEQMLPESIAILPSAQLQYRNHDAEYPFRQNSDFYYLTGFSEPNSVLVLLKDKTSAMEYIIFNQPLVEEEMIWTGPRFGIEGALKELRANKAYSITELDSMMPTLLAEKQQIYYSLGRNAAWDARLNEWLKGVRSNVRKGVHAPTAYIDLLSIIHELRLKKSPAEIELMKKAAQISGEAYIRLMNYCKPKLMEYELEAEFVHECLSKGCRYPAYSPIVGGGQNACILHYVKNDQPLKEGELVLIDAGGEFQYYASDITRTFPVNGRFSNDQKSIYNLVLKAQLAAIKKVRPGILWNQIQDEILSVMVPGLIELGILKGQASTLIENKAYRSVYMHGSGHWLGLDVHDAGEYKIKDQWRPLEPGMVLTVEPGIYIAPNTPDIDKRWWGIGVRIEDDILVTEQGHVVLSEAAPKTVEEIETLMSHSVKSVRHAV